MSASEKPKLVFLVSSLGVGGSETKVVKLANSFAQLEEQVEVAYLNSPDTLVNSFDPRVSVTCLHRKGKYSPAALQRFGRSIAGKNVVIVAVYLYPLLYALPARRFWASRPSRVVCLINTSEFLDEERWHGWVFAPFLRGCDRLIYGCESQLQTWSEKFRLPPDKSDYIYNGVDETRFAPAEAARASVDLRKDLEIPTGALVIGSVGRLAAEKDFQLLVRLLRILRDAGTDAYLILVGEGPEQSRLTELARTLGVSTQLRFLGLLDDVRPAVSAMDIFVLPSRAVETFSNAALEAMAMAKPVVLSDIGGASEMIIDGESGLLFPSGDLGLLSEHVRRLSGSEDLRKSIGIEARKRVLGAFRYSDMVDHYRREFFSWNEK